MIDFAKKIWILDGGMASSIYHKIIDNQCQNNPSSDIFYANFPKFPDSFCLSQPTLIEQIHLEYLNAGADIITSNTFNANPISLEKNGIDIPCHEICSAALQIAKTAIQKYSNHSPSQKKYIAGNIGPISKDDNLPESKISDAYVSQAEALIKNGADLILLETICSLQQCIIASEAIIETMNRLNRQLPLMLSFALSDDGTTYDDNKSIADIISATKNLKISSIGINCGCGIKKDLNHIMHLAKVSDLPISFHPSAGLPDKSGKYNLSPRQFVEPIITLMEHQQINIIGGCCGVSPKHIELLAKTAMQYKPKKIINSSINRKLN